MTENIGYEYHHCAKSPENGVEIVFADFNEETGIKKWWLHLFQEATEEDLEEFKADGVGEILFSNALAISFCPFCGEML